MSNCPSPQHKKECKRRAAELHDEALFKEVEPEDCPICFLRMPYLMSGGRYKACCGKVICSGCIFAPVYDHEGNLLAETCPFCRTPPPTSDEEALKIIQKRAETGDAKAVYNLGCHYANGSYGLPRDYTKALEFYHRAGELGEALGHHNIGLMHSVCEGVHVDMKKAVHYWELAARGGHVESRHNLGMIEGQGGNFDRALRHFMIAVKGGYNDSLTIIRQMIMDGDATKDDYSKALKSYQAYLDEIKSDQRDKAAAADDEYKYY